MEWNDAKERQKFKGEWKELIRVYRRAGMSEADIQSMYEFDLRFFRQRRNYCMHNESKEEMEEKRNPVYLEALSVEDSDTYSWIQKLDDKKLHEAILSLKKEDLEILTLWAIEGYKETEIAKRKHVSQQAISKKVTRIKNFLKKSVDKVVD